MGPLCGGEVGSTGPQGNRQGCRFLFVRAGCPVEKPGRTSRTCRAWMPGKRQAGWPSLWLLSLRHARESDSPSEGGRKLFAVPPKKERNREHPPLTSILSPTGRGGKARLNRRRRTSIRHHYNNKTEINWWATSNTSQTTHQSADTHHASHPHGQNCGAPAGTARSRSSSCAVR